MNLRHLEYFVAVAEAGSITGAARVLGITQPALSRQVRAFEEEMGWNLFERGARTVELTHAGRVVLSEGKIILRQVNGGLQRMRQELDGGVIRVGYAPSLGGDILKVAMGCYVQRHQDVKIHLSDATTEEMRAGVRDGEMDLMVGVITGKGEFEWALLKERKLVLAVPRGHGLARRRLVRPGDLDGERMLLLSRVGYPEYWEQVTGFFRREGMNAKVAGEFDGIESLGLALEAGLGVALVAEGSHVGDGVRLVKMEGGPEPVRVGVGWKVGRVLDEVLGGFVEELKLV